MITLDQIRERLQESIRQSGMTQTEIAKRTGVIQAVNSAIYVRKSFASVGHVCKPVRSIGRRPCVYPLSDKLGKFDDYYFGRTTDKLDYLREKTE